MLKYHINMEELIFKIQGNAVLEEESRYIDEVREVKRKQEIDEEEQILVSNLNIHKDEVEEELYYAIKEVYPHLRARVEITFIQGSINFEGIIAIANSLAIISGTFAFFEYTIRFTSLVKKVIQKYINKHSNEYYSVNTIVLPPNIRNKSKSKINQLYDENKSLRLIGKDSTFILYLLVGITIINIILFIGGTVLNGVSVDSVYKNASNAQKEMHLTLSDFNKDVKDLKQQQDNAIKNIKEEIKQSKNSLYTMIDRDIPLMEKQSKNLKSKIDQINKDNDMLSKENKKSAVILNQINNQLQQNLLYKLLNIPIWLIIAIFLIVGIPLIIFWGFVVYILLFKLIPYIVSLLFKFISHFLSIFKRRTRKMKI